MNTNSFFNWMKHSSPLSGYFNEDKHLLLIWNISLSMRNSIISTFRFFCYSENLVRQNVNSNRVILRLMLPLVTVGYSENTENGVVLICLFLVAQCILWLVSRHHEPGMINLIKLLKQQRSDSVNINTSPYAWANTKIWSQLGNSWEC